MTDAICAYDDGDIDTNRTTGTHIQDLVTARYSRRDALRGGFKASAFAILGSSVLAACSDGDGEQKITATAGSSGQTSSGRVVTLSGGTSSNVAETSQWRQTSGPAVTLSGSNTATATFLAPSVSASTPLVFEYVATSASGAQNAASTTVTVDTARLGFTATPKSLEDAVKVPAGYSVTVLYRLGDPIAAGVPAFANNGTDTNFAQRAGDHHDGMYFFGLSAAGARDATASTRGLIAMNHENITPAYLHVAGPTSTGGVRPFAEVIKEMECHGVSVIEVNRTSDSGTWSYSQTSAFNRRITPFTPTAISGPVKGATFMKTAYSTDGTAGRGTINNCANGFTPWGTYLTCEENWVGYFRRDASDVTARAGTKAATSLNRYGRGSASAGNNSWTTAVPTDPADTRVAKFNITIDPAKPADGTGDFRNEIFQYGWVVEIDPYDAASTPRKRTALGRMNHEGAWPGAFTAGVKPAWYMGDDAQNEYLYKFVSSTPWAAADATATDRLALGDKYLDAGTLYVAKFNADGSGAWMPLVFGTGNVTAAYAPYAFSDQADVLANARLAADAQGATRMDRPEWTAVNPVTGEMYLTLTNNSSRNTTTNPVDAANPRAYTDPKVGGGSTSGNANGHIIRLKETGSTTEATAFTWDIYAFGSGSDLDATNINLSGLDASNDFSSCDGLWFSRSQNAGGLVKPLMWIETDDGAYTDVTNCMLLVAQPGTVGDGGTKSVTSTLGGTSATVTTRIGAAPATNLRRFLVGPKECEITGLDSTPDGRSVFVNIQHPGENGTAAAITSNWPGGGTTRPRSATIVITKDDGGVVGL
jgi:uncharacterized protein